MFEFHCVLTVLFQHFLLIKSTNCFFFSFSISTGRFERFFDKNNEEHSLVSTNLLKQRYLYLVIDGYQCDNHTAQEETPTEGQIGEQWASCRPKSAEPSLTSHQNQSCLVKWIHSFLLKPTSFSSQQRPGLIVLSVHQSKSDKSHFGQMFRLDM